MQRRKEEVREPKHGTSELDTDDSSHEDVHDYNKYDDKQEPEDHDHRQWQSMDGDGATAPSHEVFVDDDDCAKSTGTNGTKGAKSKMKGMLSKVKSKLKRNK
jgi:hypothetical protein